jgi:hypothetical protein
VGDTFHNFVDGVLIAAGIGTIVLTDHIVDLFAR